MAPLKKRLIVRTNLVVLLEPDYRHYMDLFAEHNVEVIGSLYDCDFNQMFALRVNSGVPTHIREFGFSQLFGREIVIRSHCFACTAGTGSSCQGSLTA